MQKPSKKDLIIFELIWAFIFIVIALQPISKLDADISTKLILESARVWALIISTGFAVVALVYPRGLIWFYKTWVKFGEFIGGIISRVVLFALFYIIFTPVALLFRIIGKDELKKKLDPSGKSYWITRETQPGSLKKPF